MSRIDDRASARADSEAVGSVSGRDATLAASQAADPGLQGELAIALLLRGGVVLAALLLAAALVGSLVFGTPLSQEGVSLGRIFSGESRGLDALALVGLLIMGATPVARVALSIPVFAKAGERSQALIGLGVLVLLAVSILLGAVEG
ncbi:DUF1634 domain-containing protein [Vulgatibacter incomptus]|uniref:DUF1634 domain-containing protein n=1 Tax=Vulgatibacter incomptus TaxID=1391653 RepID=A0A0K1PH11_9BACT|nr:DUF1634 domain-containing protein [Vulgatibacter incomptus]AKU92823.1 hypothetical protein AKJ08_3210 [Vulgatibacter incomptus]